MATGTVIFIITPWTGNKPKFWICGGKWGISDPRASGGLGNVESWGSLSFFCNRSGKQALWYSHWGSANLGLILAGLQTKKTGRVGDPQETDVSHGELVSKDHFILTLCWLRDNDWE